MFRLDKSKNELISMTEKTFAELKLKEAEHIEEWIMNNVRILENKNEEFMVIARQHKLQSGLETDILALSNDGTLVIIELKRDSSTKHLDWQAIKYAAQCSVIKPEEVIEIYARHENIDVDVARDEIIEYLQNSNFNEVEESEVLDLINRKQGIILVAREYEDEVYYSCNWLIKNNIDVRCFICRPFVSDKGDDIYITLNQVLPPQNPIENLKALSTQNKRNTGLSGKNYSNLASDYDHSSLKVKLIETFKTHPKQFERLKVFLELLLKSQGELDRNLIIEEFNKRTLSRDLRQAGTHVSNISQLITNKHNDHLRQIIKFNSDSKPGARKDFYKLDTQYRTLLEEVLTTIASSGPES